MTESISSVHAWLLIAQQRSRWITCHGNKKAEESGIRFETVNASQNRHGVRSGFKSNRKWSSIEVREVTIFHYRYIYFNLNPFVVANIELGYFKLCRTEKKVSSRLSCVCHDMSASISLYGVLFISQGLNLSSANLSLDGIWAVRK